MANRLFVNNGNGRRARATRAVFDTRPVGPVFSWMDGMVKDGLADDQRRPRPGQYDDLLGIRSGSHAMAIDTSAALGTIKAVLGGGNDPNVELGRCAHAGPGKSAAGGGRVQPGR